MSVERLVLTSLKKAVFALSKSVAVFERLSIIDMEKDELDIIKAGVIQHFEFCYELCWKFIKRWLEMNINPEAADGVTRRELFRQGVENKLLDNVDEWMIFHSARNRVSHIYDEDVAEEVFAIVRKFLPYAKSLLSRLESKND
jgi:nucleotidyltransferase substrate binding protein (TIGR01987 family)